MARRRAIIRASEVGEYLFCQRAWWLKRVAGEEPAGAERRELGTWQHQLHGQAVVGSQVLLWLAVALGMVALLVLILR